MNWETLGKWALRSTPCATRPGRSAVSLGAPDRRPVALTGTPCPAICDLASLKPGSIRPSPSRRGAGLTCSSEGQIRAEPQLDGKRHLPRRSRRIRHWIDGWLELPTRMTPAGTRIGCCCIASVLGMRGALDVGSERRPRAFRAGTIVDHPGLLPVR